MGRKQLIVLCLCVTVSVCQFSYYIPKYSFNVPSAFISNVPVTQPIEAYASFKQPTFKSVFNKDPSPNLNNAIRAGLSSCRMPLIPDENGYCKCPKDARYAFGKCIGITAEDYYAEIQRIYGTDSNNNNNNNNNSNNNNNNNNNSNNNNPPIAVQCPVLNIDRINNPFGVEGLATFSRTYDGTNNNERSRDWGSTGSLLQRRLRSRYADGISIPITNLPGARVVSNTIGSQLNPIKLSQVNATFAFTIFGQFIDHDIDLTLTQRGANSEFFNIQIPSNDQFFQGQSQITFTRSQFVDRGSGQRRHKNNVTSWLDASQIYGSDNDTNCALRQFAQGKLKNDQSFLPKFNGFSRAGDIRALQNSILTTYHTIFLRQHNRKCDQVLRRNPQFNDETVFQIAKNYVTGLYQKIVLKDFVSILLGDRYNQIVGSYRGYQPNTNPNIPTEFSTASYRVGHSLLVNSVPVIDQQGRILRTLRLNDLFFNQQLVDEQFLGNILRGASRTLTKQKSGQLVDDVRNLLVLGPDRTVKLDLFSLNIQRSRDHGLPTYNEARSAFGLPKIRTFEQILPADELFMAARLKSIYGTPDNLELFVGIICEKPVRNGIVGELGAQIVGQTFRNLRDGDRFWYENNYPRDVINEIESTSLGDIVKRNTDAPDLASNLFKI